MNQAQTVLLFGALAVLVQPVAAWKVSTPHAARLERLQLLEIRRTFRPAVAVAAVDAILQTRPDTSGMSVPRPAATWTLRNTGLGGWWYQAGDWTFVVESLDAVQVFAPLESPDGRKQFASIVCSVRTRRGAQPSGRDPALRRHAPVMTGLRVISCTVVEEDAVLIITCGADHRARPDIAPQWEAEDAGKKRTAGLPRDRPPF